MQDHKKQEVGDQKQGQYDSKSCGERKSERSGSTSHETNDVRHEGLMITMIDPPGPSTGTKSIIVGSQASKGRDRTGIKDESS
jgi:hypothetical protein